ncbi:CDF family Co(II)/Ni(II) efflux transporter DmeF [Rhodobium gokarnense]|uniref:Cation diffusion facilitator family transporter n=1 Tax=Rhodobium gokarnense TaxID=364296 RepID=A0ABT3HBM9_9HYPH|nr:CDF family Co(II)/Ni(II) efflux transporter DmeF [Rhodobium gokarnense]MCW2307803.1 cation diffusion facilitator family transporter [Rhodobium gokarnense]
MHIHQLDTWRHGHTFIDLEASRANERRTLYVVVLTATMMVVEIAAGWAFNSMALLADGWHMATHAGALGISVFAYRYARSHVADRRFTFGVGKVEVLGGYTSAIVLGIVALLMVWESALRLIEPRAISFDEAIAVAVLGLIVNLASAWILHGGDGHHHHHGHAAHHHHHDHDHDDDHHHDHGKDHNLRAAYLHVLADALTSILAIVALVCGKLWGWNWMDAAMGIVGAVVISRWAFGLLTDTGAILLDSAVDGGKADRVRGLIEADADNRIVDLHLWRVGPEGFGAIVSLVTHYPRPPEHYRELLSEMTDLVHVTIEVNVCTDAPCLPVAGLKA